jgi:16S rRNA C967 or C1407 C5-methylase (RsmB/RsmF family)
LLSDEATARHVATQSSLLAHGFRMLKPGGALVYATCSLTRAQNEGVVAAFLAAAPGAALAPVPFAQAHAAAHRSEAAAAQAEGPADADVDGGAPPASESFPWAPGGLPHTLRFSALRGTSGLFLARITKSALESDHPQPQRSKHNWLFTGSRQS